MCIRDSSTANKVLCALIGTYSITFPDISFFDPPYRGAAGAISGADFAKKTAFLGEFET